MSLMSSFFSGTVCNNFWGIITYTCSWAAASCSANDNGVYLFSDSSDLSLSMNLSIVSAKKLFYFSSFVSSKSTYSILSGICSFDSKSNVSLSYSYGFYSAKIYSSSASL